jgi:two-component system chemotaxis response regulator CheY
VGINVLIVDDSALIRQVVRKVVKQTGIQPDSFFEAGNGREALDIIAKNRVDLVLSDINMPRMDGLQMLLTLRRMKDKESLPVIVVSTEGSEDTMREAMKLGATGYVLKPFTAEALAEQLRPLGFLTETPSEEDVDLSAPDAF